MKKPLMLFTYPGGKYRLAKKFQRYYPPHHHFISVFGGSGAEIMLKPPSPLETFNDKDDLIYAVFAVLQDSALREQLLRLLENTPDSRTQYELCHQIIRHPECEDSFLRQAWAYLVCAITGFHGPHPALTKSWARCSRAEHSNTYRLLRLSDTIRCWRDRFRRVHIERNSWEEVLRLYDSPDTFFFVDPPYHPDTCSKGLYRHELTRRQHIELLEALNRVKGSVLLCGIDHPFYQQRLFHWRRVTFNTRTTMNRSKYKPPRQETIWLNYEGDGSKVHEHKRIITERFVRLMGGVEEAERQIERLKRFMRLPQ